MFLKPHRSFDEICHHSAMASVIPRIITTAPPFSNDPRDYIDNSFKVDMSVDMVRDQRMSGIGAQTWNLGPII